MALVPIIMPQLGESIAEATIIKVLLSEGDIVEADKDVIEVETNKALMQVTSPCSGKLSQILIEEGKSYLVGAILGYVEVDAKEAARLGLEDQPRKAPAEKRGSNASPRRPRRVKLSQRSRGCRSRRTPEAPHISLRA